MAYICTKEKKCKECEHFLYDKENDRMACFAEIDEEVRTKLDAKIIEECIIFDDMEDYRFPLKPKDEVFGPNCYQDDEEFDYSEVVSYWYGES